jgi:phage terminase large subunit GpA-like protein
VNPADPHQIVYGALGNAIAPRKPITVSEWADVERKLSSKGSAEPGPWRTSRNPPLAEPMNCASGRSAVQDIVLMWPVQIGKTEVAANILGYSMDYNPGPIMVCLPGEVSMHKWVNQKLNPMIEETPAVARTLTSMLSRDASNTRTFKDFAGGQLYLEHAGSPSRLKSTSVRTLLVDELDEFAANFPGGDDPLDMLLARTSAFPSTYKRLFISTPQIKGFSRIDELWLKSDQRRFFVACPHCGHEQHLEWAGLKWNAGAEHAWYVCQECAACIDEHEKTAMIRNGKWKPTHPERKIRGYHINCLYYQLGLGPRWAELARAWLDCQNDPARLKTFVNDRLAEPWEDRATQLAKYNIIQDRAEPYRLLHAPNEVLILTAGVDTQDNRLAVQIVGWGKNMTCWVLYYDELIGDPAEDAVWANLTDLLNRPIHRADNVPLYVQATAIDAGGHRTEAVKFYCRHRHIRRPLAIFGAVPANAPVLSRPKYQEIKWRNTTDKRGQIQHVGTVAVKNVLFAWLSVDAETADIEKRRVHFSQDLDKAYFEGLVSETFDPRTNRYIKKRAARNEPLDTWVYAYAAAHHSELRLHTYTAHRWQALAASVTAPAPVIPQTQISSPNQPSAQTVNSPFFIPD